jgi:ABC-type Fe3+ transport system permease subunit
MSGRDDPSSECQESNVSEAQARRWRKIRPRRPTSLWGWLLWLLIVLLCYLLISSVLVPWWYSPVPTDIPPATPNSNSRRT